MPPRVPRRRGGRRRGPRSRQRAHDDREEHHRDDERDTIDCTGPAPAAGRRRRRTGRRTITTTATNTVADHHQDDEQAEGRVDEALRRPMRADFPARRRRRPRRSRRRQRATTTTSADRDRSPVDPPRRGALPSMPDETSDGQRTLAAADGGRDRQRHAGQLLGRRAYVAADDGGRGRAVGCWPTGAAIVDVGGESTRPGADAVSLDEELRRVVPVLERLAGRRVSIDTSRAEVARQALALGAELVNDVTALRRDPELAGRRRRRRRGRSCLMHMQGEPRTMQEAPRYDDVVSEVAAFLEERLAHAVDAGIEEERICLDPGFGFGKTPDQNLALAAPARPHRRDRSAGDGRVSRGSRRSRGSFGARTPASGPTPPRSAPRSRRSTEARRCSASTTCARTWRRSRSPRRWSGVRWSVTIELHGIELHGVPRRARARAPRGSAVPRRRRARPRGATPPRRPTASRTRSTTATSSPRSPRCPTAAPTICSRRSRPPSPTRWSRAFRSTRARVRVRKPDVVLPRPVDHAAVVVERRVPL